MFAVRVDDARGWLLELLQVALATAAVWFLLATVDIALHQRLTNDEERVATAGMACVISPPLSERVHAGRHEREAAPISTHPNLPRGSGELGAALARLHGTGGSYVTGVREDDVFYLPAERIASFMGAEFHQASAGAPARLLDPAGLIKIVPMSPTAWRNFTPVELPQPPRVIEGQLHLPVRGIDALLPISATWDDEDRSWRLACRGHEIQAAVPEDLFEIVVERSTRTLTVSYGGQRLVSWSCCVGAGERSPVGTWHVRNKARWAAWRSDEGVVIPGGSPRNPLGARWLGTTARGRGGGTIGIHGTNQPSSIGRRVSAGCIRLMNHHAIELYDTIPIGTRVVIRE